MKLCHRHEEPVTIKILYYMTHIMANSHFDELYQIILADNWRAACTKFFEYCLASGGEN
jgi:hypothetical protein